jgi:hypothetical protein
LSDKRSRNDSGTPSEPPFIPLGPWCVAKIKRCFHERRAERQKETAQDRFTRRSANATIAIAALTFIVAGIGILQWRVFDQQLEVFRGQLGEMRSGAALTQQLIEATRQYADATTTLAQLTREKERPLVVVTRSDVAGPFILKNGAASIKVSFVLNNDGHSATVAAIFAKMYVQQRSAADLAVEQRDVCKEALSGKKIAIVADGGSGSQETNLTATAEEVRKGTDTVLVPNISFLGSPTTRESYISPYLRGCVQYTYGTEPRRREFSGIIARADGAAIDPKDSDIRPADMKVSLMTEFSN